MHCMIEGTSLHVYAGFTPVSISFSQYMKAYLLYTVGFLWLFGGEQTVDRPKTSDESNHINLTVFE